MYLESLLISSNLSTDQWGFKLSSKTIPDIYLIAFTLIWSKEINMKHTFLFSTVLQKMVTSIWSAKNVSATFHAQIGSQIANRQFGPKMSRIQI